MGAEMYLPPEPRRLVLLRSSAATRTAAAAASTVRRFEHAPSSPVSDAIPLHGGSVLGEPRVNSCPGSPRREPCPRTFFWMEWNLVHPATYYHCGLRISTSLIFLSHFLRPLCLESCSPLHIPACSRRSGALALPDNLRYEESPNKSQVGMPAPGKWTTNTSRLRFHVIFMTWSHQPPRQML